MTTIKMSEFAKRQTEQSRYAHFEGSWEELEQLTLANFDKQEEGYRDGVVLIPVPSDKFYTSICKLTPESILETVFESRQDGEQPVLVTSVVNGEKMKATETNIVLYRKDVLAENNEQSSVADWEIISVNASPVKNLPMHVTTMMRNQLELTGGTAAHYSSEEYAESAHFWSNHSMVKGK